MSLDIKTIERLRDLERRGENGRLFGEIRPHVAELLQIAAKAKQRMSRDYHVNHLAVPVRVHNALLESGSHFPGHQYSTVRDIEAASDRDLLTMPNFGPVSLRQLRTAVDAFKNATPPDRQCYVPWCRCHREAAP